MKNELYIGCSNRIKQCPCTPLHTTLTKVKTSIPVPIPIPCPVECTEALKSYRYSTCENATSSSLIRS